MSSRCSSDPATPVGAPGFLTTHWSVVLAAAQGQDTAAQQALATLCQTYWYPLYACVRRQGHSPHDAEDLTQEFFARLLAKNYLAEVRREKGRFRSFLLAALNHFLANEWDHARRQKRGGGQALVSLNLRAAEARYRLEPADNRTPEALFERRWALTLLEGVLQRLEADYAAAGKQALFAELQCCLTGERAARPYSALAGRLKLTEGAVKVAVHRLRQRYRHLLRAEITRTVSKPEEVADELRHLFQVIAG
jgi:RNA polymerase sigma-70 factor (ECF subfamily)